jgi:hypothetical protein
MPGFVPSPVDQQRQEKYDLRRLIEERNRQAIREGGQIFDQPSPSHWLANGTDYSSVLGDQDQP